MLQCNCSVTDLAAWKYSMFKKALPRKTERRNETQVRCGRCGLFRGRIDDRAVTVVGRPVGKKCRSGKTRDAVHLGTPKRARRHWFRKPPNIFVRLSHLATDMRKRVWPAKSGAAPCGDSWRRSKVRVRYAPPAGRQRPPATCRFRDGHDFSTKGFLNETEHDQSLAGLLGARVAALVGCACAQQRALLQAAACGPQYARQLKKPTSAKPARCEASGIVPV